MDELQENGSTPAEKESRENESLLLAINGEKESETLGENEKEEETRLLTTENGGMSSAENEKETMFSLENEATFLAEENQENEGMSSSGDESEENEAISEVEDEESEEGSEAEKEESELENEAESENEVTPEESDAENENEVKNKEIETENGDEESENEVKDEESESESESEESEAENEDESENEVKNGESEAENEGEESENKVKNETNKAEKEDEEKGKDSEIENENVDEESETENEDEESEAENEDEENEDEESEDEASEAENENDQEHEETVIMETDENDKMVKKEIDEIYLNENVGDVDEIAGSGKMETDEIIESRDKIIIKKENSEINEEENCRAFEYAGESEGEENESDEDSEENNESENENEEEEETESDTNENQKQEEEEMKGNVSHTEPVEGELNDSNTQSTTSKKSYECPNCGKTFSYQKRFLNHIELCTHKMKAGLVKKIQKTPNKDAEKSVTKSQEKIVKWYECNQCDAKYKSKTEFNKHATSHAADKPHECPQCGRRFSKRSNLKVHISTHSDDKLYTCPLCAYNVNRTDRYKIHMQSHGIANPFKCALCGEGFPGLKPLNSHLNSHNSSALDLGTKSDGCALTCSECGLAFDKSDKYKAHMTKAHDIQEPYECSLCGKNFSSKLVLTRHLQQHNFLLQASAEAQNLNENLGHTQELEVGKQSSSSDSDGESPETSNSSNHKVQIEKGKEAQATVNGTDDLDHLNQLKNTIAREADNIEGNSVYNCRPCGLKFYKKELHLEHLKEAHNKAFPCKKCGRSYTRKSNLNKHKCVDRRSKGSYKCTTCEISFTNPQELDEHIVTHISGLPNSVSDSDRLNSGDLDSLNSVNQVIQLGMIKSEFSKKKKAKHSNSPMTILSNFEYATNECFDNGLSHSDIDHEQLPKKKKKRKHKDANINDDGEDTPNKKVKLKNKISQETSGKKKTKPKTCMQMLEIIERELSKFQTEMSKSRKEHEASAIEYEKLVVYEFMKTQPAVLPETDYSYYDNMFEDVKVNDQISSRFFM